MLTTIPFSGFYDSLHSCELQTALDYVFADRATGSEIYMELAERAYNAMNWRGVHEEYAKEYAEQFAHEFKIPSLKFESMASPRFYNFTTDRIFCNIDPDDLRRIMATFDLSAFAEYVREKFTSRGGFSSFYSPVLAEWGSPKTYDHNQAGAVLEFYAMQESNSGKFDVWEEFDLMESPRCNGFIEYLFGSNCGEDFHRLTRLHDYLQDRAERLAA